MTSDHRLIVQPAVIYEPIELWKDAPKTLVESENFFLTPIFIQNFNQLSYLRRLLDWLLGTGYTNICIIDNHSSYVPLLQFYAEAQSRHGIHVVRRDRNGTRTTLWDGQYLERFGVTGPFVYTDSDVVPDKSCPADVIARLASYLRKYPHILKAGLGLRIDDLPESYTFRREVAAWERQFWRAPVCRGAVLAQIDTTFALYRPNSQFGIIPALRTGWPYLARHETWYQDSTSLSDEQQYYASEVEKTARSNWSRRQLPRWLLAEAAQRANSDLKLLHLACGRALMAGWINVDRDPAVGADIVFDLETCAEGKLPLAHDSVDGIFMHDQFQKIDAVGPMMSELYRVSKPDARFIIRLPYGKSGDGSSHGRPYFPSSFAYYAQPAHVGLDDYYRDDWRVKRVRLVVDSDLIESEDEMQARGLIGQKPDRVKEMIVELRAVKPPRPRQQSLLEWPLPVVSGTSFDAESDFEIRSSA
jgi:SAM-dependent methyltransferase